MNRIKRILALALCGVLALGLLAGCGQSAAPAASAPAATPAASPAASDAAPAPRGPLRIVTTIFPCYDWVRSILGDQAADAELTMLLDNGADLHSYQPTAEDMVRISDCDLFVFVGGESDDWVFDALRDAANRDMRVVNLVELLGDNIKEEELVEGMEHGHEHDHEHGHGHSHGSGGFEDAEVKDRTLEDWQGDWQSVYPYLLDGSLDKVMEHKAEDGEMSAKDYFAYYRRGFETDVERIVIDGDRISFFTGDRESSSRYVYRGYQIYTYESGNRGVRYFFEAEEGNTGAPRYIQFSDHEIAPTKPEHFHLYFGNESFEKLSEEMENWPTYFPAGLNGQDIAEEMMGHDHHHDHDEDGEEHELEHEHEAEVDEHVWLSLRNAARFCRVLAAQLGELDGANAARYNANAEAYIEKLNALDAAYREAVDRAQGRTLLFGDRFPFRYLTDDYGLRYYAAFSGCSAETEASFETVRFLAEKLDELELDAVLTIEGKTHRIAETVAETSGRKDAKILTLDSMQSVTAADVAAGASYLGIMEQNLEVLKNALK